MKMLRDSGIDNVQVISTPYGKLTDHYNPINKTINLSDSVYNENSVMSAAVAAHETGHAIQHAQGYAPATDALGSCACGAICFSSREHGFDCRHLLLQILPNLLLVGIILFALTTLFSIITLPVEVDASRRALEWLKVNRITSYEQQPMA